MKTRRPRRKLVLALTVAALCVGMYQAADAGRYRHRIVQVFYKYICLPSVDHYGQLSFEYCKQAKCKIIINHRRHTCLALCHGRVHNKSHRTQRYSYVGLIPPYLCDCCYWHKVRYVVFRNGYARGIAWGHHDPYCDNEFENES